MKDNFHLLDLLSQAAAVKQLLNGKTANEKLSWLSTHGKLSQMERRLPEWPDTYLFKSRTGAECFLILQGDILRFVGDNHLTNIEI
jgi:hypothetical protein